MSKVLAPPISNFKSAVPPFLLSKVIVPLVEFTLIKGLTTAPKPPRTRKDWEPLPLPIDVVPLGLKPDAKVMVCALTTPPLITIELGMEPNVESRTISSPGAGTLSGFQLRPETQSEFAPPPSHFFVAALRDAAGAMRKSATATSAWLRIRLFMII